MPDSEYVNQRFASVDRKLDSIDNKLDEMRKEQMAQHKDRASEIDRVWLDIKEIEGKHGELIASHTTELSVWRWGLALTCATLIIGAFSLAIRAVDAPSLTHSGLYPVNSIQVQNERKGP